MSAKPDPSAASAKAQGLSLEALARRRALLSGLGKGGAALAATVPIQSLAGSTVLTCVNGGKVVFATVSGLNSGVQSVTGGGGVVQVPACGGSHTYWCKSGTSWPSGCYKTTVKDKYGKVTQAATTFYGCFGRIPPNGSTTTTLWDCLQPNNGYGGTDTAVWCAAYLNGMQFYLSGQGKFPYPNQGVQSLPRDVKYWYATDSTTRANALKLFTLIHKDTVS